MRPEYSAGGVVLKKVDNEYRVILCFQQKLSGSKVYCLPKGHIEEGETIEAAALREVKEETGISARIIKQLTPISYTFTEKQVRIHKIVYFFLMECVSEEEFVPNHETEEILWCVKEIALEKDPYSSEKKIIRQAFTEARKRLQ